MRHVSHVNTNPTTETMTLQFSESLLEEWTDGKLVIQKILVYCNGQTHGQPKYRFFLYGSQQTEAKTIRDVFGWNGGPAGQNRHWSVEELNAMLQDWLNSIPKNLEKDSLIVKSIQILLLGSIPDGAFFENVVSLRCHILYSLANYIVLYMNRQTPMSSQEAESLVKSMSNLSF